MNVLIENSEKPEEKITLKLTQEGNEVTVEDVEKQWDIVTFKVVDGKLRLAKHGSIESDPRIAVDKKGQILETKV